MLVVGDAQVKAGREELYQYLWSESLGKVASRYRVSKTVLRDACQKYDIPVPNAVYWLAVRNDEPVERDPLPSWVEPPLEIAAVPVVTAVVESEPETPQRIATTIATTAAATAGETEGERRRDCRVDRSRSGPGQPDRGTRGTACPTSGCQTNQGSIQGGGQGGEARFLRSIMRELPDQRHISASGYEGVGESQLADCGRPGKGIGKKGI